MTWLRLVTPRAVYIGARAAGIDILADQIKAHLAAFDQFSGGQPQLTSQVTP
jgi:hypothetical protein